MHKNITMKKHSDFLSDDFYDFVPKKQKIVKNSRSKQISFQELESEDLYSNVRTKKKVKHADYS